MRITKYFKKLQKQPSKPLLTKLVLQLFIRIIRTLFSYCFSLLKSLYSDGIIIINGTLARSLEPVVTECKEHTIHTQTQVVASRKPKEIKRTHEGEANFTT